MTLAALHEARAPGLPRQRAASLSVWYSYVPSAGIPRILYDEYVCVESAGCTMNTLQYANKESAVASTLASRAAIQ